MHLLLLLFLGLNLTFGQAQNNPEHLAKTLVLNYEDFGPQALAYELIGYEFYQWNGHGSSDPNEKDVIFVVVYKNTSLKKVKAKYPVIKNKSDYRYIEYNKAIKFIDSKIAEWENIKIKKMDPESFKLYEKLTEQYKETRQKILKALDEKNTLIK